MTRSQVTNVPSSKRIFHVGDVRGTICFGDDSSSWGSRGLGVLEKLRLMCKPHVRDKGIVVVVDPHARPWGIRGMICRGIKHVLEVCWTRWKNSCQKLFGWASVRNRRPRDESPEAGQDTQLACASKVVDHEAWAACLRPAAESGGCLRDTRSPPLDSHPARDAPHGDAPALALGIPLAGESLFGEPRDCLGPGRSPAACRLRRSVYAAFLGEGHAAVGIPVEPLPPGKPIVPSALVAPELTQLDGKLARVGWPAAAGDLRLDFHVLCCEEEGGLVAGLHRSGLTSARSLPSYHLKCELQHVCRSATTPVLVHVQRSVNRHVAAWALSISEPRYASACVAPLVEYLQDKMAGLDRHCAVCDSELQGADPLLMAPLCGSFACRQAMESHLASYLHPASLDLLISLGIASLASKEPRRLWLFRNTFWLDDGYWLSGMLQGNKPHLENMLEKLRKAPLFANAVPPSVSPPSGQLGHGKVDPVLSRLISWVVLTFNGVLVPLFGDQLFKDCDIFVVRTGNRERLDAFRSRKAASGGKSWFAFHGSPLWNWHAILRQDVINVSGTPWQVNGATYGPGVYLSTEPNVSWGYSPQHCVRPGEKLRCLGLCEVLARQNEVSCKNFSTSYRVPNECDVTVRALIVSRQPSCCLPAAAEVARRITQTREYQGNWE